MLLFDLNVQVSELSFTTTFNENTETVLLLISEVSRLSDDKLSLAAHVEPSVCVEKKRNRVRD